LPPIVERLRTQEPLIEIEVIADNEPSDLARREADIAIRNFRPVEEDLIARKIRDDIAFLYATPDYLASIGHPTTLAGYGDASFIGITEPSILIERLNSAGLALTENNFPITAKNYLVHWEFVKRGLGIGIMSQIVGDQEPLVIKSNRQLYSLSFRFGLYHTASLAPVVAYASFLIC